MAPARLNSTPVIILVSSVRTALVIMLRSVNLNMKKMKIYSVLLLDLQRKTKCKSTSTCLIISFTMSIFAYDLCNDVYTCVGSDRLITSHYTLHCLTVQISYRSIVYMDRSYFVYEHSFHTSLRSELELNTNRVPALGDLLLWEENAQLRNYSSDYIHSFIHSFILNIYIAPL